MDHLHPDTLEWTTGQSPKGKFQRHRKELSVAMGAARGQIAARGGHPFEVELVRLPPGAINWPYHSHTVEHEFYIVVGGSGIVRTPDGEREVRAGEVFHHPPGEPHQLRNPGPEDLIYYVIANNEITDDCHYPDSDKWAVTSLERCFRPVPVDYYDGEE